MRRLILGSLAAGTLALASGCGTKQADAPSAPTVTEQVHNPPTEENLILSAGEKAPAPQYEAPIDAVWESKLRYQSDSPPSNCAVAGRVRFFSEGKETSQEAEGQVIIQLYDHTSPPTGQDTPPLEEWRIEAGTMKFFLAANTSSPEYVFVLPWSTYKPEITQVRMEVKYEPKTGKMVSAKSDVLSLDRSDLKEK